jgi:hypothetical protein
LSQGETGGTPLTELVNQAAQIRQVLRDSGASLTLINGTFDTAMKQIISQGESRVAQDMATGKSRSTELADIKAVLTVMSDDGYSKTAIAQEQTKLMQEIDAGTKTVAAATKSQVVAASAATKSQETDLQAMINMDLLNKDWTQMSSDINRLATFLQYNAGALKLSQPQVDDMLAKLRATMSSGVAAGQRADTSALVKSAQAQEKNMLAQIDLDKKNGDASQMAQDVNALRTFLTSNETLLSLTPAEIDDQIAKLGTATKAAVTLTTTPVELLRAQSAAGDALTGAGGFMQTVASLSRADAGSSGESAQLRALEQQNRQLELEVALLSQQAEQGLTLINGVRTVNATLQSMKGTSATLPPPPPASSRVSSGHL